MKIFKIVLLANLIFIISIFSSSCSKNQDQSANNANTPTAATAVDNNKNSNSNNSLQVGELRTGEILLKVNGEPIYKNEITFLANEIINNEFAKYDLSKEDPKKVQVIRSQKLKEISDQLIEDAVIKTIVRQKATAAKLTLVSDTEVDAKLLEIKSLAMKKNMRFEDFLKSLKLKDENEYRLRIKDEMLTQKYLELEFNKAKFSNDDLKKIYNERLETFKVPELRNISMLTVTTTPQMNSLELNNKLKKITEAKEKINAGLAFDKAVMQYSEDEQTKNNGGYLGEIPISATPQSEIEQAAATLKVNQVSDIIKSPYGYHLLKVSNIKKAHIRPFNDEKVQTVLKNICFIDNLKKSAKIEFVQTQTTNTKK